MFIAKNLLVRRQTWSSRKKTGGHCKWWTMEIQSYSSTSCVLTNFTLSRLCFMAKKHMQRTCTRTHTQITLTVHRVLLLHLSAVTYSVWQWLPLTTAVMNQPGSIQSWHWTCIYTVYMRVHGKHTTNGRNKHKVRGEAWIEQVPQILILRVGPPFHY